jgi:uncharacterized protein VirK/YbjX
MEILRRINDFNIPKNISYVYAKLSNESIKKYKPKEFLDTIKIMEDKELNKIENKEFDIKKEEGEIKLEDKLINDLEYILLETIKKTSSSNDNINLLKEALFIVNYELLKKDKIDDIVIEAINKLKENINKNDIKTITKEIHQLKKLIV